MKELKQLGFHKQADFSSLLSSVTDLVPHITAGASAFLGQGMFLSPHLSALKAVMRTKKGFNRRIKHDLTRIYSGKMPERRKPEKGFIGTYLQNFRPEGFLGKGGKETSKDVKGLFKP